MAKVQQFFWWLRLQTGIGLLIVLSAGCASTSRPPQEAVEGSPDDILARLEAAKAGTPRIVADFPRLVATTQMLPERIEAAPLQQGDGSTFSPFGGRAIGYPVLLRLENADRIPAEIRKLDIWRRNPGSFGQYEPFVGTEGLVLQPGEVWEGAFIVSRKAGWFRLVVEPAAPEGWSPVHGGALPSVFFRGEGGTGAGPTGRQVAVTFWNLGQEEAVFRYWIANGEPEGIPAQAAAEGLARLGTGEELTVSADLVKRNWALVTMPGEGE